MRKHLLKKVLPVAIFASFTFACKKEKEEEPIPGTPPLTREFTLSYIDNQDETQASFATLDQAEDPFVFNWTDASQKPSIIHFGFGENAGQAGLFAPMSSSASMVYADAGVGVAAWPEKGGATFEVGPSLTVNFDGLTVEFIDDHIPDEGFGGNNSTEVLITQGKIVRFIVKENQFLKYKGYLKVISLNNNGNPKTAVVRVKYIEK